MTRRRLVVVGLVVAAGLAAWWIRTKRCFGGGIAHACGTGGGHDGGASGGWPDGRYIARAAVVSEHRRRVSVACSPGIRRCCMVTQP